MHRYSMPYAEVWGSFPVLVGFGLLEAAAEARQTQTGLSYAERCAVRARKAKRAEMEAQFNIEEPS